MGAMPANEQGEGPLRYSDKLSPAVNHFLIEASRQDLRVCTSVPDVPRFLDTKCSNRKAIFFSPHSNGTNISPQLISYIMPHFICLGCCDMPKF